MWEKYAQSKTATVWPPLIRLRAMCPPMLPSPMKPTCRGQAMPAIQVSRPLYHACRGATLCETVPHVPVHLWQPWLRKHRFTNKHAVSIAAFVNAKRHNPRTGDAPDTGSSHRANKVRETQHGCKQGGSWGSRSTGRIGNGGSAVQRGLHIPDVSSSCKIKP